VGNPARIVVVYGHPEDVAIFEGYYQTTHMSLALAMPYVASFESAIGVSGPAGEKAAFYRIATLTFNSEAELEACMVSAAGQAAFADIANFATGGATATIVSDIHSVSGNAASRDNATASVAMANTCGNSGSGRVTV
jgi:uncharacterized protein (TIGR02118 family)